MDDLELQVNGVDLRIDYDGENVSLYIGDGLCVIFSSIDFVKLRHVVSKNQFRVHIESAIISLDSAEQLNRVSRHLDNLEIKLTS